MSAEICSAAAAAAAAELIRVNEKLRDLMENDVRAAKTMVSMCAKMAEIESTLKLHHDSMQLMLYTIERLNDKINDKEKVSVENNENGSVVVDGVRIPGVDE
jgi:hypothetical protein